MLSGRYAPVNPRSPPPPPPAKKQPVINQKFISASEPLDLEHRLRPQDDMTPVGLKNVGNTCYFNSLL